MERGRGDDQIERPAGTGQWSKSATTTCACGKPASLRRAIAARLGPSSTAVSVTPLRASAMLS
ncbi:MAG: hypothetical protein IAG13_09420 [Deltaproteobacteria bacterium]|nr:hypothetical protein [Nannocystaceae bacterium]